MTFSSFFNIVAKTLNIVVKHAIWIGHLKDIALPQYKSQQIISQYVDDKSFIVRTNESSVKALKQYEAQRLRCS